MQAVPPTDPFLIVGIGASAGGITALKDFFEEVPADSGCAYVVILHLSPDFESHLADILQRTASIPVQQVRDERVKVEPNNVYVVPPAQSLQMSDGCLTLTPVTSYEERRAPVDIFFRTLAESNDGRSIAVVLSGTGPNGSMGVKRIKEKGGIIIVQDPKEAEYSDMPRASLATELVDYVLPVKGIPAHILQYREHWKSRPITEDAAAQLTREENDEAALLDIFTALRKKTGHDFAAYKRATVIRRIGRRMGVRDVATMPAYAALVKAEQDEVHALLKDLLISVTNFFRDRKAFEALEREVMPRILQGKGGDDSIRIWVAGCATGEEAYSIAMLFAEKTAAMADPPALQIFATDIDDHAIANAREGLYSNSDVADVSPERLRRFFTKEGDAYRVRRELRESILFARHNILRDPPFSHLALATCRNLLIYLNRTAQTRVMQTMHFALEPGAYLFLGNSETADGCGDLYVPLDREQCIFQSRAVQHRPVPPPSDMPAVRSKMPEPAMPGGVREVERISLTTLHYQMLEHYAPPSVLVNADYDIVHLSEQAGQYMHVGGGEPSYNLLKVVRPELRLDLRAALHSAVQASTVVRSAPAPVTEGESHHTVTMVVRPVTDQADTARGFLLVIFEKSEALAEAQSLQSGDAEAVAQSLEDELTSTRTRLRASTEQYEVQTEELRASNEELQAINEELRSAAEELETGKEELQSVNEELMTVNQELKVKIDELNQSNNDFKNLMAATDIGTLFLDRGLRVKLFTPAAREIFNLIPADYDRPLSDITHHLVETDLMTEAEGVMQRLHTVEREVHTANGLTFLMRVSPYRTADDHISGVVVTFVNISRRENAEQNLRMSEERLRLATEAARIGTCDWDYPSSTQRWNDARFRMYGMEPPDRVVPLEEFFSMLHPDDEGWMRETLIAQVEQQGEHAEEYRILTKNGEVRWLYEAGRVVERMPDGKPLRIISVVFDITERKQTEEALRTSEQRYQAFVQQSTEGIWRFEMKEPLMADAPVEEQTERIYKHAFLAECNNAMAKIYGYETADEIIGKPYTDFMPRGPENDAILTHFIQSGYRVVDMESREQDKDGHDLYFLKNLIGIVEDGWMKRIWGTHSDITARKALERQKDDFIGVASHELRTPVTSIKAYAEMLRETMTESGNTADAAIAQKLDQQVDRLTILIHDLLDATRLTEGGMPIAKESFDLAELIGETTADLQKMAGEQELQCTMEPLPLVLGDRERVGQVITNLVSNAIKYAPQSDRIIIGAEQSDGHVTVSVQDFGIGIEEEVQARIFERFFRAPDPDIATYPGLGLGLFIAAEIIKRHDGEMWVKSKRGAGSTFFFTLPVA